MLFSNILSLNVNQQKTNKQTNICLSKKKQKQKYRTLTAEIESQKH